MVRRAFTRWESLAWLTIAIYLSLVIGYAWKPTPLAQALAAIGIASAFSHAVLAYGWKNAVCFLVICLAVTFTMENIGSSTGFPFRRYHFEVGADSPHIGSIPIIVGPLWFGMGYFSWSVAATLLDDADRRLNKRFNLIALPIMAAITMTQWDLVMEAPNSTLFKAWVWHEGGAYFGVPLSNFFGWVLTSWLFFQAFTLYLHFCGDPLMQPSKRDRSLRVAAILFYVSSGLTYLTPWLFGAETQKTEVAVTGWREGDLQAVTALVMLFTMGFTSILAVLRLIQREVDS